MQVNIVMDLVEGEDFTQAASKPLASMPCGVPGQVFVAFEKPEGACSLGRFSNTMRFYVKEVCNIELSLRIGLLATIQTVVVGFHNSALLIALQSTILMLRSCAYLRWIPVQVMQMIPGTKMSTN